MEINTDYTEKVCAHILRFSPGEKQNICELTADPPRLIAAIKTLIDENLPFEFNGNYTVIKRIETYQQKVNEFKKPFQNPFNEKNRDKLKY